MNILQRELDFSKFDSTGEELINLWAPTNHTVRSHRRRSRFTKTQICAAFAAFLAALSVGAERDAEPVGNPNLTAALAALAPPSATRDAPVAVIDRLDIVERRGGSKASRSQTRGLVRNVRQRPTVTTRWVAPLRNLIVTSCYGPRWGTMHRGIDFDGEGGDPIRSVGTGTVVQAGWKYSGLGYSVAVDHGDWITIYAHASRVIAHVGQRVKAGTKIALVGETGNAHGTHLHLALAHARNIANAWDNIVNPAEWLRERGIKVACG